MLEGLDPVALASSLSEYWSPRVVAELDDSDVKVAKVRGTFGWHQHEHEDELFFVLKGALEIALESGVVELGEGQMFVVPRGARHNPAAKDDCLIMLIERKSTRHTGDEATDKTRSLDAQLRPIQG